ncbi:hypothetical protein YTPLAS73_08250 [Nitrosarchaeum sp.]|nr:hypothetical protein YTPLAS73_08250 [Nitrosarchaeum sp.]
MVSTLIWIAIIIGVFFVGIGVSYAHFANTYDPMSMKFQNQELFNQMMSNNPKMSQQWMDSGMMNQQQMMQNSNYVMEWMAKDPKHVEQMSKIMKEDHVFMSKMMSTMMNDPELRLQMIGHMSETPEAFKEMMSMMGSVNMTDHMGSGMNQQMIGNISQDGMMMGNMTTMTHGNMVMELMKAPETREKMMELMKKHISEMNELFSSNLSYDEFNMKMADLLQDHMQSMQDLMSNRQMTGMMHP